MGGFFGAVGTAKDIVLDIFFGTDYHSHLGTKNAGMAVWNKETGFKREIHNIENTPFRTKFECELQDFAGSRSGFGCISDADPQPLIVKARFGTYAISTIGIINNAAELIEEHLKGEGQQFMSQSNGDVNMTELVSSLICHGENIVEGIEYAQSKIKGSMTILIMTNDGSIIAARDKMGRLPVHIGKKPDAYCVSFESFAYQKLGYEDCYELGPGEIVKIKAEDYEILKPAGSEMKICAFLWTYYGYPNSCYEGKNVELMRYRNGEIMARDEIIQGRLPKVDYVAGVPDSGVPHSIGYANRAGKQFARPFVKYTPTWPRSFTPEDQNMRNRIAKMKQIPVTELIAHKKLLFVDDSIVRGTQLKETVEFLYESGAEEVHMRSACPPIMYACKFLNFSRSNSDNDLLTRKVIHELEGEEGDLHISEYADNSSERGRCLLSSICKKFGFDSLGYQSLEGLLEAIDIDPEKVCTYCWTGKE